MLVPVSSFVGKPEPSHSVEVADEIDAAAQDHDRGHRPKNQHRHFPLLQLDAPGGRTGKNGKRSGFPRNGTADGEFIAAKLLEEPRGNVER